MSDPTDGDWEEYLRWKEQRREGTDQSHGAAVPLAAPHDPSRVEFVPPQQPTHAAKGLKDVGTHATGTTAPPAPRKLGRVGVGIAGGVFLSVLVVGVFWISDVFAEQSRAEDARAVAQIEQRISGIGVVTINSDGQVQEVVGEFSALRPDLQEQVGNLDVLEEAAKRMEFLQAQITDAQWAVDKVQGRGSCLAAYEARSRYLRMEESQKERVNGAPGALRVAGDCEAAERAEEEERKRSLIRVDDVWLKRADGAGRRCTFWVTPKITNISKRTMNGVSVEVAVRGDGKDKTDLDGKKFHDLQVKGTIQPGGGRKGSQVPLTYECAEDDGIAVYGVMIEYADGSFEHVGHEYLQLGEGWERHGK